MLGRDLQTMFSGYPTYQDQVIQRVKEVELNINSTCYTRLESANIQSFNTNELPLSVFFKFIVLLWVFPHGDSLCW